MSPTRTRRSREDGDASARRPSVGAEPGRRASPAGTRSRIARIGAHQHEISERSEFVPGALMVKCAEDVVANVPDLHAAHVATIRALALPERVAAPFEALEKEQRIKEVIPVFSRLTRGRSFAIAPTTL
ncbi:MAG TPA: hypothetical protein VF541_01845, partial [Longimicrobium sp.]